MHIGIKMNRQIAQFTPDPSRQRQDLLLAPAQHTREQCVAVGFDALEHVDLMISAQIFEFGVFRPWALGELFKSVSCMNHRERVKYFVDFLFNIRKPQFFHPRLPGRNRRHLLAKGLGGFVHQPDRFDKVLGARVRVVVRGRHHANRRDFEPAAWGQVVVRLLEDVVVVAHESFQFAPVDKVE